MAAHTNRAVSLINGPNLNLLGKREPAIYGSTTLAEIETELSAYASTLGVTLSVYQSNIEGEIVNFVQQSSGRVHGIIINPGGYSHTSVAIRDALTACAIPAVEVHLSNLWKREEFRHTSLISAACVGVISGFGKTGYRLALDALVAHWATT